MPARPEIKAQAASDRPKRLGANLDAVSLAGLSPAAPLTGPSRAEPAAVHAVGEGHDHNEARPLIGCVVASEIFDILKNMEPHDEERYVAALRKLPALPE